MTNSIMETTLKISGKKVTLKEYITKGDHDYINAPLYEAIKYDQLKNDIEFGEVNPSQMLDTEFRSLVCYIKSINGKTSREDITAEINELPMPDYEKLVDFQRSSLQSGHQESEKSEK